MMWELIRLSEERNSVHGLEGVDTWHFRGWDYEEDHPFFSSAP